MTKICRCGAPIPVGDTIALINHVASVEHEHRLMELGILEHTHSYLYVNDEGHPVDEGVLGAVRYHKVGCPACEAGR